MGKKIVVVDDNILLTKTIDMCLRKKGHNVRVFNKGADAVKYLFEAEPDSILLDLRLPDCDGWFIARLMGKIDRSKHIPLIILSVLDADNAKMSEIKPFAYIQKPFDMGRLMQVVERSLNQQESLVAI